MVHHATDGSPIIPVRVEVLDAVLGDDSVDPSQHGFAGGEAFPRALDLVLADEGPDETQDQLQVTIIDILWTYRMEEHDNSAKILDKRTKLIISLSIWLITHMSHRIILLAKLIANISVCEEMGVAIGIFISLYQ